MAFKKHNVNNRVKAKLNETGARIVKADSPHHSLVEDSDGYVTFQHWEFMYLFGDSMYLGGEMPFDSQVLIEISEE